MLDCSSLNIECVGICVYIYIYTRFSQSIFASMAAEARGYPQRPQVLSQLLGEEDNMEQLESFAASGSGFQGSLLSGL